MRRLRLTGGILVLGLGALLVLAYLTTVVSSQTIRGEVNDRLDAVVKHSSSYIDQRFSDEKGAVAQYASLPVAISSAQQPGGDTGTLVQRLNELKSSNSSIVSVSLIDAKGKTLASTDSSTSGSDVSQASWFSSVIQSGQSAVSDPSTSGSDSDVVVAAPVIPTGGKDAVGVLATVYRLDSLSSSLTSFAQAQGLDLIVTDRNGDIVTATGDVSGNQKANPAVAAALSGKPADVLQESGPKGDLLAAYGVSATAGWAVVVDVPTSTALGTIDDLRFEVMAVTVALGILFLAGIRMLNGSLRRQDEIEEALRTSASQLKYQALHDALTGLPNRVLFSDRMSQAMKLARRNGTQTAVLLLDMNKFKQINDTLGHHYGDLLLQEVSRRLNAAIRTSDTAARLGGDEFAVVAQEVTSTGAAEVALKVAKALDGMYQLGNEIVESGASIGVAVYPDHGQDLDSLLRYADARMYEDKRARKMARQ